jgi:hypothetical protein
MSAERGFVPDLLLEQYALGELPDSERVEVEAALASDPLLRSRLAALKASNEEILAEARPAEVAAAIRRRMVSSMGPRRAGAASAPFLTAAAAVLVLVGAALARGILFPSVDGLTRAKGGATGISIFRKAAAGPVELRDGSLAAEGDILQIKYSSGEARYGAIFSLDGRGTLTWHLPAKDAGPGAPLLSRGEEALSSAYELDDAPGFERFFFISSKSDFDLEAAAHALRELAASGASAASGVPRLPAGVEWKSILLVKAAAAR